MTNTQQKQNQKKQENSNPSSNQGGRGFNNQQNENTGRSSERETPRGGRDSVNPGQKMKKDGFEYEEI